MISQREFFNSMAEKWDQVCQHDTEKIQYILNLLDIQKRGKILDVGTGTGILIPFLVKLVGSQGKVAAIDISDKMLELAKRKYSFENVSFICGDVLQDDLQKEYYDFIICYSVFPHFNDQQLAVRSMSKYLKTGGKFIICHSQSREEINNLHKKASKAVAEDNLPSVDIIKNYFSYGGLKTVMEIDNDKMFVVIAQK